MRATPGCSAFTLSMSSSISTPYPEHSQRCFYTLNCNYREEEAMMRHPQEHPGEKMQAAVSKMESLRSVVSWEGLDLPRHWPPLPHFQSECELRSTGFTTSEFSFLAPGGTSTLDPEVVQASLQQGEHAGMDKKLEMRPISFRVRSMPPALWELALPQKWGLSTITVESGHKESLNLHFNLLLLWYCSSSLTSSPT